MEEKEDKWGYWKDKKILAKAILFSSISLLAVPIIYVMLKKLEKKEKEEGEKFLEEVKNGEEE